MLIKITRIFLKICLWALVLLIVLLLVFDRVTQFRMDDADLQTWFRARHVVPRINYYESDNRKVRYIETGDQSQATILFIHGAPSSLSYWRDYLSDSCLLERASMYAVDRPGYGYAGLGDPLPYISTQAAIIKEVLDSLHKVRHPVILVAASYGSPIACRLAMDYPELIDGIVLIAPPLGPGREKIFWFTPMIENPLLHWVVPRMLQSANLEKIHHREELTKMLPLWPRIRVPVIYLQGTEDGLVYTSNAEFAKTHLVNVPSLDIRMIPGRGHLIAFAEQVRIKAAINEMLDKCLSQARIDRLEGTNSQARVDRKAGTPH
ncbi:MAG: alpha/beta hydrolase [Puia sp.]|nr:alpha/beta hydrolase [Puia sp.]